MVYFLYDENHVPETRAVEDLVKAAHPEVRFIALHGPRMPLLPLLKLYESQMQTWESQVRPFLVENSLLVGIGLTGTAAAVLQGTPPRVEPVRAHSQLPHDLRADQPQEGGSSGRPLLQRIPRGLVRDLADPERRFI